ncbi:hypothetical protein EG347_14740 [Chryseobacterium sp. G0186]|nr:hypothetical protein EG347_14740 [Chryseobacterium sp. G0186]
MIEEDDQSITNCSDMPLQCLYVIHIANKFTLEHYSIILSSIKNEELKIQQALLGLIEQQSSIIDIRNFNQSNLFDKALQN